MSSSLDLPGAARLLIYSQDGLGLGHLRRTSLLAGAFLDALPGSSVLTISDSPAGHFFDTRPGCDHLKLPSIRKVGPGDWSPVSLGMSFTEVLRVRQEAIRGAAVAFEPDLLLVDHMPHGAMGELVPTLRALEGSRTRVVLGLRDILDAPATIRRRWRLEGAFETVERHFDDVLVYGSRDVFDVAAQYGWPRGLSSRLHYCGYVCAPRTRTDADAVRRRYLQHRPGSRLVVVMAGGGADAYLLFDALVRAVPMLQTGRPCAVVIVTGPFLPATERARLRRLAKGLPVQVVSTVHDATAHLAAADLVVSMAGYNTTAEILSQGVPALLVPRAGPSAEQQIRAGRFADRGWVGWIPPDALTPTRLAASMDAVLDGRVERPVHAERPDLRGRQRATARLLQVLAGADEPDTGAGLALSTTLGTGTDMIPLRGGD